MLIPICLIAMKMLHLTSSEGSKYIHFYIRILIYSIALEGHRGTTDDFATILGWSGGAKVLGKLPVPGRPTNSDYSRSRAYCACSRCGWGLFGHFCLSSITSLFFLSLSGRRPDID